MSVTQNFGDSSTDSNYHGAATVSDLGDTDLINIGIELEMPVLTGQYGDTNDPLIEPGSYSGGMRDEMWAEQDGRDDVTFVPGLPDMRDGTYIGSDHTGAEITSGMLDLRTESPEQWFRAAIEYANDFGWEYVPCGQGSTNFGSHFHLSNLSSAEKQCITDVASEPWGRAFFCSSITRDSLDPWRHGGARPSDPFRSYNSTNGFNGHYEFRLPEPLLPSHFDLVISFLRKLGSDGPAAAYDYAEELVLGEQAKDKLTAVRRYRAIKDHEEDFPPEEAINGESRYTEQRAAEWFHDYVEN